MEETNTRESTEEVQRRDQIWLMARLQWLLEPKRAVKIGIVLAGVGLVVIASVIGGRIADPSQLSTIGYPGVFFLSFLGSAALVLPVPGLISLCAVSVVLVPVYLGLAAAAGETLGEISGYAIGYGGGGMVENNRHYRRVRGWMESRGWLIILILAVVPNPLFDLVGVAAGATRYPVTRFLGIVLVGKVIKGVTIAYLCHHGIRALPWIG